MQDHHPPRAPLLGTLIGLLNRNSLQLLLIGLRELPKTGLRGLWHRTIDFIAANRMLPEAPRETDLADALALLRRDALGQVPPQPAQIQPPQIQPPQIHSAQIHSAQIQPIDILLPVYNGLSFLKDLLPLIAARTDLPYRLIIVDDASPEPEVGDYLREFADTHDQVTLLRNPVNLGFVKSVNRAFEQTTGHLVILNQDTQVPPGWLSRLMRPILLDPRVASATPYTNAGTICSFPDFPEDSALFADLSTPAIDRCFGLVDPDRVGYVDLPTGVGFCMAVNRMVADRIGLFDAELFGRGYGEENHWCQRAAALGYRNLMVPNLFVYHRHGGSFTTAEKQQLIGRNLARLNRLYPSYPGLVRTFIQQDPLRRVRDIVLLLAASREAASRTCLCIDHALGGGANAFMDRRSTEWLEDGAALLSLRYHFAQTRYRLTLRFLGRETHFQLAQPADLLDLLQWIRIDAIHVNSLFSFPDVPAMLGLIGRIRGHYACRLTYYLHDYYPISPVYSLLNHRQEYCGVPADPEVCRECLAHQQGEYRLYHQGQTPLDIRAWRAAWGGFLRQASEIRCFSRVSADILRRVYPGPEIGSVIRIEPHTTPALPGHPLERTLGQGRGQQEAPAVLTIGVLGAINAQKGAGVLKQMAERIRGQRLPVRIVVIGILTEPLPHPPVTVTGRYERDELPSLVERHAIDLVFLPSIWPETYLFTADEAMMLGLPLALFNLGAAVERVADYDRALVIDRIDADLALDAIRDFMGVSAGSGTPGPSAEPVGSA